MNQTEIIVTAYPKSGITWLIHLISDAFDLDQQNQPGKPNLGHWGPVGGRGIVRKHHSPYLPEYDGKTVVFLQRDPRDVVVSASYYRGGVPILDTIEHLGKMLALENGDTHNYETWVSSWFNRATYSTRYEWLHLSPLRELANIHYVVFGEWPDDDGLQKIEDAIGRQSFPNMQQKMGKHFCRKGVVGDWRNHFNRRMGQRMNEILGRFMLEVGYVDSLDWWKELR